MSGGHLKVERDMGQFIACKLSRTLVRYPVSLAPAHQMPIMPPGYFDI